MSARDAAMPCSHGRTLYIVPEHEGQRGERVARCCADCGAINLGRGFGPPVGDAEAEGLPEGASFAALRSLAAVVAYFGEAGRAWEMAAPSRDAEGVVDGFRVHGRRTVLLGLPELPGLFVQQIRGCGSHRWGRFSRKGDGSGWYVTAYKSKAAAVAGEIA